MPTVTLPEFVPHDAQQQIIDSARRNNVCCMGRRFGKTQLMKEVILNYAGGAFAGADGDGRVGLPCAWYAPNDFYFTSVFNEIAFDYKSVIHRSSSQPRPVITFKNGGRIDFWTLENPYKCGRGNYYARVIIDEAAHARYLKQAWEQSIAWTLADLHGDAWFISTPKGLNYFYELYNKKDDNWISHNSPSMSNPYLDAEWFASKRDEMPELVFAQEVLAQFVTFGAGMIKPEYIVDAPYPKNLPVALGVDLAISEKASADWTVIVAMGYEPTTGFVYIKEVERVRGTFHIVLNKIKAAAARHSPYLIAIEQVQYQASIIQELARSTFLPVKGIHPSKDKITRSAPLITKYEQKLVRHDPSGVAPWFIEELLGFPDAQHDDGVDAAVYAFQAVQYNKSTPLMLKSSVL